LDMTQCCIVVAKVVISAPSDASGSKDGALRARYSRKRLTNCVYLTLGSFSLRWKAVGTRSCQIQN
jgi:hypothetical protein